MNGRKSLGLGLIVAVAAMATMAFAASSASATVVEPAGQEVQLVSTDSVFIPSNAFSQDYLHCPLSVTGVQVPKEGETKDNVNQEEIGEFSQTSGSVTMQMKQPTFRDDGEGKPCQIFQAPEKPTQRNPDEDESVADLKITQQDPENVKKWTASVQTVKQPGGFASIFAISVPQGALTVVITAAPFTCELVISAEDQQSQVMGELTKPGNLPTLQVDGQIQFDYKGETGPVCEAVFGIFVDQPMQFEAKYTDATKELQVTQEQ